MIKGSHAAEKLGVLQHFLLSVCLFMCVAVSVCVCFLTCMCVIHINLPLWASPWLHSCLKKLFETQWLQITDKENYTVRIYQCENHAAVRPHVHVHAPPCLETEGFLAGAYVCVYVCVCMCTLCVCFYPSSGETPRTVCLWLIQYALPQRDGKETVREGGSRRRGGGRKEGRKREMMRCKRRKSQRNSKRMARKERREKEEKEKRVFMLCFACALIFIQLSKQMPPLSLQLPPQMQQFSILMLGVTCTSKMTSHCHVCSHFVRAGAADSLFCFCISFFPLPSSPNGGSDCVKKKKKKDRAAGEVREA